MGRAKSVLQLIKKEKLRNSTFQDRSNTLKKKVHELATLCDIKAVVIIYAPKQDKPQDHPLEPEIWPQNRDEVLNLIEKFKAQAPEDCKKRTTLLLDFFLEKIKKAQKELTELRNTNVQSKYPTWDSRFDSLQENELRRIDDFLENNIGKAKAKLEQMKANKIYRGYHVQQPPQRQPIISSKKRNMDSDAGNQAKNYFTIDPRQAFPDPKQVPILVPLPFHHQRFPPTDHYRNQTMARFGHEYAGGASYRNQRMANFGHEYAGRASYIMHDAPLPVFVYDYPTMAGTVESISYVNNLARAPPNYYVEGRQPISQHVMEYHAMTGGSTSHHMVASSHQAQYYEHHKWQR